MRKLRKILVILVAVGLVWGLIGCPTEENGGGENDYDKYYGGDFKNNRNGTVEVVNNTQFDMLLFTGEILSLNYIVGGVKAGSRGNLNFSAKNDYQVGGYELLRAVRESEFHNHKTLARVDYSAMVTYGEGRKFITDIVSTTYGAYQYTVNNRSQDYGLELRKNSPEGEKVAYLTKGEVRRIIQSTDSTMLTLYPVWVAFNNVTKTIVTFTPNDGISSRDIQPKPPGQDNAPENFPENTEVAIVFDDIKLPFATIKVRNNQSRVAVFRIGSGEQKPESGYVGITSGAQESYEIRPAQGTDVLNLNIYLSALSVSVPVRYQDSPSATGVVIDNGYVYNVAFNLKQGAPNNQASSYEAWLVKGEAISTGDLLISK